MTAPGLPVPPRWQRTLAHCTSRSVESGSVAGAMLVVAVVERLLDNAYPAPLWHCVTVGIVAWAVSVWIPVTASRFIGDRGMRAMVVVSSYIVAAVAFAFVTYVGLADHAPPGHAEATLAGRLTVIVPSRFALWLGMTFLADASERMVARRVELARSSAELEDLIAMARADVLELPGAAAHDVRAALATEIATLRSGTRPDVAERLYALIENVVRPMSQRLAAQVPRWDWGTPRIASVTRGGLTTQLVNTINPRTDLLPGLTAALYAVLATLPAVVTFGVQHGVVAVMGVAVAVYLASSSARITPTSWYPRTPLGQVAAFTVRAGAVAAIAAAVMLTLALGHPRAMTLTLQTGVAVLITSLTLGMTAAGARVISSTDEQVAHANDQIAWRIARLRAQRWVTHQGLAMKLHGSVQSTMQACLVRLRNTTENEDIERVLRDVEESLDLLLATPDALPPLRDQLSNITDTWRGIANVHSWLTAEDAAVIDADAVCATLLQSVVQDSVSNAIRHGGSTDVSIDIEVAGDLACLTIANDGDQNLGRNTPGFGTAQLEACAVSWERDLSTQPRRLHALLPLVVDPVTSS